MVRGAIRAARSARGAKVGSTPSAPYPPAPQTHGREHPQVGLQAHSLDELVELGTLTSQVARFLDASVAARDQTSSSPAALRQATLLALRT